MTPRGQKHPAEKTVIKEMGVAMVASTGGEWTAHKRPTNPALGFLVS